MKGLLQFLDLLELCEARVWWCGAGRITVAPGRCRSGGLERSGIRTREAGGAGAGVAWRGGGCGSRAAWPGAAALQQRRQALSGVACGCSPTMAPAQLHNLAAPAGNGVRAPCSATVPEPEGPRRRQSIAIIHTPFPEHKCRIALMLSRHQNMFGHNIKTSDFTKLMLNHNHSVPGKSLCTKLNLGLPQSPLPSSSSQPPGPLISHVSCHIDPHPTHQTVESCLRSAAQHSTTQQSTTHDIAQHSTSTVQVQYKYSPVQVRSKSGPSPVQVRSKYKYKYSPSTSTSTVQVQVQVQSKSKSKYSPSPSTSTVQVTMIQKLDESVILTAVCALMCVQPTIFADFNGLSSAARLRRAIIPGISEKIPDNDGVETSLSRVTTVVKATTENNREWEVEWFAKMPSLHQEALAGVADGSLIGAFQFPGPSLFRARTIQIIETGLVFVFKNLADVTLEDEHHITAYFQAQNRQCNFIRTFPPDPGSQARERKFYNSRFFGFAVKSLLTKTSTLLVFLADIFISFLENRSSTILRIFEDTRRHCFLECLLYKTWLDVLLLSKILAQHILTIPQQMRIERNGGYSEGDYLHAFNFYRHASSGNSITARPFKAIFAVARVAAFSVDESPMLLMHDLQEPPVLLDTMLDVEACNFVLELPSPSSFTVGCATLTTPHAVPGVRKLVVKRFVISLYCANAAPAGIGKVVISLHELFAGREAMLTFHWKGMKTRLQKISNLTIKQDIGSPRQQQN
ncbi:Protein of unknown function [Gryllus bimaculatus]|nr:Protein of unknown function [Gryllus bimaculatus]